MTTSNSTQPQNIMITKNDIALVINQPQKDIKNEEVLNISLVIGDKDKGIGFQEKDIAQTGILKKSESRGTKPFYLMFEDLFYQIQTSDGQHKNIINHVSGCMKSGEITAIMGPSGCGKTSLLNYLTGRIEFPKHSTNGGRIYLNSEEINTQKVSEYSSYVMQDDILFDVLTPTEILTFIAKLKGEKKEEEYKNDVNELIDILKINRCKDTRIGNPLKKGLSGGEKKRVSIGCEIMSNPSILFLDEPTSGLDSTTSEVIISFLKELAVNKNMIIAFTIHQPSSSIFTLFDRLILVNKGQMVYQGPVELMDKVKEKAIDGIVHYFDKELQVPLDAKANPSDSFMHLLEEQNAGFEGTHVIENAALKDKLPFTELYQQKRSHKIESEITGVKTKGEKCTLPKKASHKVSAWKEFTMLLWRSWLGYIRNPFNFQIQIIMTFIFSFISLSIFWRMKNDYQGTYNKAGFLFFFSVNIFLSIVFNAVMIFPKERAIFLRDNASKIYGVSSYYIAKNVVETPLVFLTTLAYAMIVYYGVGLRDDDVKHFFIFIFAYVVLAWLSQSVGYFLGTTFSDLNSAIIITQFLVVPFFLFSGFLINTINMPKWCAWLQYFSPFRYSVEAGMRNEFDNNPSSFFNAAADYNLDIGLWKCILIMFCWGCFLRTIGGVCLKFLVKKVG